MGKCSEAEQILLKDLLALFNRIPKPPYIYEGQEWQISFTASGIETREVGD